MLAGKPLGKRPFGRSRLSWEDNIWMDLKGSEWKYEEFDHSAQESLCDWSIKPIGSISPGVSHVRYCDYLFYNKNRSYDVWRWNCEFR